MTRESLGSNYIWNIHEFLKKFSKEKSNAPKLLLRLIAGMIDKENKKRPKIGKVCEALVQISLLKKRNKSLPSQRATPDIHQPKFRLMTV